MTTKSLWGEIDVGIAPPSPVIILQKQASKLEEITGGNLTASVRRSQAGGEFVATLEVVAPYLYNYRLAVVEVQYPPEVYPIEVFDLVSGRPDNDRILMGSTTCMDEEQFIKRLSAVLSGPKLRRTLSALVSHSQAERSNAQPTVAGD